MGEAKRRKAEIEALKRASPEDAARWRESKRDSECLVRGIDPESHEMEPTAAMCRILRNMFERAKESGNIDPPVEFLHTKVAATVRGLRDITISCRKGCSHCCNIWVSATAPEVLYISKIVKLRGKSAIERVRSAHQKTKDYDFDSRGEHPYPCPLLEGDNCSIYENRPKACRLAVSTDANICARAYHNLSDEGIPAPHLYMSSRANYAIALAISLRKVGLPYFAYEFNAALVRAIDTPDAERAWLSGHDIFSDVMREPADIFSMPPTNAMYEYAFR
ncbi:MAG TPA: YkgJ family cysteine cluster protein [Alphaproteobacteria bacterium]|nr:YkgJ family cysteine cluster protein [Alphaproteobacteria bacterium]